MTSHKSICRAAAILPLGMFACLAAPPARAEEPATVLAQGTSVVERHPQVLRMQLEIHAKANDLKTALSRLTDRRAKAEKVLLELGADKASLKFGTPHVSAEATQRQQQMRMMVLQQLRARGGRPKEGAETPEPVTLALSVKAEWPLAQTEPNELLLLTHELQKKIKTADLSGKKEVEQPSEEEEELAEEMQSNYLDGSEQQVGEPVFMYVAKIAPADRKQAIADAFNQAKSKADDLAQAAGASIGSLNELKWIEQSGGDFDSSNPFDMSSYYTSLAYQAAQQLGGMASSNDGSEAIGSEPGPVRFGGTGDASFRLK